MSCPSCGHENREDARFCGECAAPLAADLTCPSCGRSNPIGQRFCDGCARPLTAELAAHPARDPRDYTPKHLADKILRSKSAIEGERKQVTVLFADVKGSMELQEGLDPEECAGARAAHLVNLLNVVTQVRRSTQLPPGAVVPLAGKSGVGEGTRTPGFQDHNPRSGSVAVQ